MWNEMLENNNRDHAKSIDQRPETRDQRPET